MSISYLSQRKRILQSFAACNNDNDFWQTADDIFSFQKKYNPVFKRYLDLTSSSFDHINNRYSFLPIQFYKTSEVKTGEWDPTKVYTSSGTSGFNTSRHYVKDEQWYLSNTQKIFEDHYGSILDTTFLCLLPSYLEREGSSLITMCQHFIANSKSDLSSFYLYDHELLYKTLVSLRNQKEKTVLIGVTYALLDFIKEYQLSFPDLIVIKTGGMKGRREEMNNSELNHILQQSLGVDQIHGEYGMTECFSQLYSINGRSYGLNQRMKVVISDLTDPFSFVKTGKSGRINLLDIANIDTCSFIATDDVGYIDDEGNLEILGRIDNSDLRGCNMLI